MGPRRAQSPGQILRIPGDGVAWREIDDEVVAINLRRSEYIAVNSTGIMLFKALLEGVTRGELVDKLAAAFPVDPTRAAADVDAFLESLEQQDLLETTDPG